MKVSASLLRTGVMFITVLSATPSYATSPEELRSFAQSRCRAVQNQPERAPFACQCFGGPGNYRYTVPAIRGTAYGGPGNYPYEAWLCPQGCSRVGM